jgi:hypothetical protein
MSEIRLVGMQGGYRSDSDNLTSGVPLIADSENRLFQILSLGEWTLHDRQTTRQLADKEIEDWFTVFEYAAAKDDPSFAIPIMQGQSVTVIGSGFLKSLSLAFGYNDMNECYCHLIGEVRWYRIQNDYFISLMTIAQRKMFGQWLAEKTQNLFDDDVVKNSFVEITEKAKAALLVLKGNPESSSVEYYVRELAAHKIAYKGMLMLAAIELAESLTEKHGIIARKELDQKVEIYLLKLESGFEP